jgi:acetylornithine deacetylase/succinyl-diaminopimelate desuccinylase-like protein
MSSRAILLAVVTVWIANSLSAQSPYEVKSPPPAGFNRGDAQNDTETLLTRLIRIDTQNPPGNERAAAEYLASVLSPVPGVETHVLDLGDGRAQLIARLHASSPSKRAVLVLAHMDVVGADASKWSTPPFEPTVRDGYLYGRGAIDDKGMLAATVAALLQLSPARETLDRDIILAATADEENGPTGVKRLLNHHFGLVKDAEFALNEGGRIRIQDGRIYSVNIQTTEKIPYNITATARGTSGHGSVPLPDNALAALSRAVGRVAAWRAPVRLNLTTRLYFAGLAEIEKDPEVQQAMESISSSTDPQIIDQAVEVLSREPLYDAALRTGQSLTLLEGGFRSNVIPSEGTANFNVRILCRILLPSPL